MRHILLMLALAVSASGQQENPPTPKIPKLEYLPVWLIDGRRAYLTCPDDKRQDCTLSVIPHSKKPKKKAKPSGLIVYGNLYHKFCPPYDPCELPSTYYIRDFEPSGHAVSTHTKAGK